MKVSNEKKVDYVCPGCGATNIVMGMFKWNLDDQSWKGAISSFIDAGFNPRCFVCGGDVVEREIGANDLVVEQKKPNLRIVRKKNERLH